MPVLRFPPLSKANPLSEVAWNPIDVRNANSTVDRVQVEIYTKSKFSGFCLFPCPAADAVCLFLEFLAALYSRRRRTKNRWGLKGPQLSRWGLEGAGRITVDRGAPGPLPPTIGRRAYYCIVKCRVLFVRPLADACRLASCGLPPPPFVHPSSSSPLIARSSCILC